MNTSIQSFEASLSKNMPQTRKASSGEKTNSLFASLIGKIETMNQQADTTTLVDLSSLKGLVEELLQQLSLEDKQLLEEMVEALKEKLGQGEDAEESLYMLLAHMILQPQEMKAFIENVEQDNVQSKQLFDKFVPLFEKLSGEKETADIKKLVEKWASKKEEGKISYLQGVLDRVFPKEGKEAGISILPTRALPIYQPMDAINLGVIPQVEGKAFALYVGMNGSKLNEQQFIRDFQNILMSSNLTSANGIQKLSIKLYPEHLGSVHVDIVKRGGEMIAKIVASSANARDVLENHVQQLRTAFATQNISVDKIEISSYLQQWKEHQQDGQATYKEQQEHKQKVVDEEEEDKVSFFEELTNLKV
jgi:Flagellar hook-length control protein FliK